MKTPEGRTYLNNAATSFPKVPGLAGVVASALEEFPPPFRCSGKEALDTLSLCRQEIARMIKARDPSEIVLCKNATEALNIAIHGLDLKGATVLTTSMEHNSVLRPLYLLERKGDIRLEVLPSDPEGRVSEGVFQEAVDRLKPRLVVLVHASSVTGAINNAERLLGHARSRECLTLLDAAQTLGLKEMNSDEVAADLIAFTGHKYMLGPAGTGGLYVRKGVDVEPVFVGGAAAKDDALSLPQEMPEKLEAGTPSFPLAAGLLHCLQWQRLNPFPVEQVTALTDSLAAGLAERGARVVRVTGPRTFIVSCILPGWDMEDIGTILERIYGVHGSTGLHGTPLIHDYIGTAPQGTVRFSLSRFTTQEEIGICLETVERLLYEKR